jgi:segregation and condensation protein A
MNEQELLKTVIDTQSWEDMIYHIVNFEGLNPWDIDITKLTDSFLEYIEKLKIVDFRIPAKVILVAAILLKLKAETLFPSDNKEVFEPENGKENEYLLLRQKLSEIKIVPPIERFPQKSVSLEELVQALGKALHVRERKEERKRVIGRRLSKEINLEEEDIESRIGKLMDEINFLIKKLKANKVEFSKVVDNWERDEIVRHFLPLLYLSSRGEVSTEQKDFFKEIFISKVKS